MGKNGGISSPEPYNFKYMKTLFVALLGLITIAHASEYLTWDALEKNFVAAGGDAKTLSHMRCFVENHNKTEFIPGDVYTPEYIGRCTLNRPLTMGNDRILAIIDYTRPSNMRRLFLIDRLTGAISATAAAHGRFGAGFFNRKVSENKNSVLHAKYFSNEVGSNAPSSGFFLAGQEYEGKFGRSLILHGLEKGVNDNACDRAVVIHKHMLVSRNKAYVLSSGCPMVSPKILDHIVTLLRGKTGEDIAFEGAGSPVLIYSEREKNWAAGTCNGQYSL